MRIVAGRAKGRRLGTPASGTRPPTGRMREAVFSSLGDVVVDADVLDLFAGSGSFGLEALSRGAASATFVEQAREAVDVLRANVAAVGLGGTVVRDRVERFLARAAGSWDVVFVDPPYDLEAIAVAEILDRVADLLRPGGVVVVHRRAGDPEPRPEKLGLSRRRRYGDGEILWYEPKEDGP